MSKIRTIGESEGEGLSPVEGIIGTPSPSIPKAKAASEQIRRLR
jgi:hypothetical protein